MVEYKRQHYIPQFYLKQFSSDKQNIWLFNFKREANFFVPIRNVCQENFFYSDNPVVEKVFSPIEQKFAEIFNKIIQSNSVSEIDLDEGFNLRLFALLQGARTKDAKVNIYDQYSEMVAETIIKPLMKADEGLKRDGIDDETIDRLKISNPAAQAYGILGALTGVEGIADLKLYMVLNKTQRNFILGDSPIIMNNYIGFSNYSMVGEQSPGLQIIFPISPEITLLFIHDQAYHIDCEDDSIILTNEEDIDPFNRMQLLNGLYNVFFRDNDEFNHISGLFKEIISQKPEKRLVQRTMKKTKFEDGTIKEIVHWYYQGFNNKIKIPNIRLNHDFNRKLKGQIRKARKSGEPFILYRNKELAERSKRRYTEAIEKAKSRAEK